MNFIAKTFKGLEPVLAQELINLGAENVQEERRAVSFSGNKAMLYRANFCLRTASRILLPLTTFQANDADEVYDKVKQMEWNKYMTLNSSFIIDATVFSDTFRHSQYLTYRVKDAIADFWMEKCNARPNVKLSNPDIYINIHVAENTVTISLDSSGPSLHKRGWREQTTTAPINEALAAGMLLMAGWNGQSDFVDPMCGSGTFLIEAAMIALNIPPGIYRQHFAFEKWLDFDKQLFEDIYNDDSDEREFNHHIYGSDASFYAVQVAEKNVKAAGLQKYITCHQVRIQEQKPHEEACFVVMNPPYGERIGMDKDIFQLYEDIGSALKHRFTGSTAWIISSNEDALKHIGLKPAEKYKLLNGELDCCFNKYELFAGERKEWKKEHPSADEDNENRPQVKRTTKSGDKPRRFSGKSAEFPAKREGRSYDRTKKHEESGEKRTRYEDGGSKKSARIEGKSDRPYSKDAKFEKPYRPKSQSKTSYHKEDETKASYHKEGVTERPSSRFGRNSNEKFNKNNTNHVEIRTHSSGRFGHKNEDRSAKAVSPARRKTRIGKDN